MNTTVTCMLLWTHGWKSEPLTMELTLRARRLNPPYAFFQSERTPFSLEVLERLGAEFVCDDKSPCFVKARCPSRNAPRK